MSGARVLKILQGLGGLLALALLVFVARSAWHELSTHSLKLRLPPAVLGVVVLAGAFFFNVALWRQMLADLGSRIRFREALQLWSFSNLGRYLPGKIWQVVGLVVVARDLGIPPGLTTAAAILALGFMVGTGALVGIVWWPGSEAGEIGFVEIGAAVIAVGLVVPLVRPGLVHRTLARLPSSLGCALVPALGRATIGRWILLFLVSWGLQGVAFVVFASAMCDVGAAQLGSLTGAYALAYVGGLLAVFAPGGIGVREGLLGHFLGSIGTGEIPAHVLAIAARLWAIAAEALVLATAFAVRLSAGRGRA